MDHSIPIAKIDWFLKPNVNPTSKFLCAVCVGAEWNLQALPTKVFFSCKKNDGILI
jgi:hypothetical protein